MSLFKIESLSDLFSRKKPLKRERKTEDSVDRMQLEIREDSNSRNARSRSALNPSSSTIQRNVGGINDMTKDCRVI